MSRRVAIVTDWFAPRLGGIESQLGEVAARLSASGNEVRVITATPGDAQVRGVPVRRLEVARLPSPPLAVSPRLYPVLRRELSDGVDLVHAHVSVVSPVGWLGVLAARSLGLPVAVTFHSILRGKAVVLRALAALAPLPSSAIAWSAVSDLVASQVRWALGGSARVDVLPNGIALDAWAGPRDAARPEVVLVAAMRLHRKKRGVQLVRAFADATRGSSDRARLVLAGAGPDQSNIVREIARLGLHAGPSVVELRAWSSPEELRRLYAAADGFVLASIHESFGIAALEARAAGLPVVARRSGSAMFLTHDVDALLAADDAELARHLRSFLTQPDLRRRLAASTPNLSRFDWPSVIAAHDRQYERATGLAALASPAVAPSA